MKHKTKQKAVDHIIVILIALLAVSISSNQLKINALSDEILDEGSVVTGIELAEASVIPTGIPNIYGEELGIAYDDVSPTDQQKADQLIKRLAYFDQDIQLNEDELARYVPTLLQISCEYCCGAKSIIFENGKAACGCAHSFAMRGLAKYLLRNHPDEFSNEDILEELGKWKTLFFPSQLQTKAAILKDNGVELTYINLASNKYRGIEKGTAGSGMVGGC